MGFGNRGAFGGSPKPSADVLAPLAVSERRLPGRRERQFPGRLRATARAGGQAGRREPPCPPWLEKEKRMNHEEHGESRRLVDRGGNAANPGSPPILRHLPLAVVSDGVQPG
jgi:hypothetical protein